MSHPTMARVIAALLLAPVITGAQVVTGAPLPVMSTPPATEAVRSFDQAELDRILSPIALYPDPLLAQVLTAATFAPEIPSAARWVDARPGKSAESLAEQLTWERVSWDPSVQSLIAFPTVLHMMATTMPWTTELGEAVRLQRADVMDAVQRLRARAQEYGYLRSTADLNVLSSPAIEIQPVNPSYVVVPYYDPVVVFAPPRPRYLVSSAIYLGFGVRLGYWYEPWGWRTSGFQWPARYVVAGYPGWNRGHGYTVYREPPRYSYRPPVVVVRGRRDDDDSRNRWGNQGTDRRGNDGRGNRESQSTGRSSQPRQMQAPTEAPRVVKRDVERPQPTRETQRSSPQSGNSEQRVARRRN